MPHHEGPADLVLTGGHVHTVDPDRERAEAVAVGGERIVAVGSVEDVAALIGSRTRVIDLHGRLLLPGFQDAHVHPISGGIDRSQCDVRESRGRDAVLATIRAYADAHPDEPWIIGSGWYMADFPNGTPRREDLDAVVPDRPAFLPNRDGHSTWVNSRALELAGVERCTRARPTSSSAWCPCRVRTTCSRGSGSPRRTSIRSGSRRGRTRSSCRRTRRRTDEPPSRAG
jgi:predicted amidohydrolase YtcJ